MKKFTWVVIAMLFAWGNYYVWSQEPKKEPPVNQVSDFMQAKLTHSQKVLEALALENYDQIAKHSQEMSLLSQAASWQVLQTPEYLQHSIEFRRRADALTQAAKEKNLDGAALAYVEITLKCVQCHKYVRNVRMARK
jgi:cytochrome c556